MTTIETDIKKCIPILQASGIILYPTDTIWGIGCNALDEVAIEKIYTLKNRPKEKSFIVLLAEARDIFQYVAAPPPDIIDILESFDRPTTVVYSSPLGFPESLLAADGSLAIRVTTDPFCKTLLKRLKLPLVSTSANISNQPSPASFEMIDMEIQNAVDYVVKHRQDDKTPRSSSAIVRITDDGSVKVLRP
jgi:L-threonylcarbamoyladenylate synthase